MTIPAPQRCTLCNTLHDGNQLWFIVVIILLLIFYLPLPYKVHLVWIVQIIYLIYLLATYPVNRQHYRHRVSQADRSNRHLNLHSFPPTEPL